jgi:cell division protein FtsN
MRENVRSTKDRFELALDAKQAVAVLVASLAVVAGVFVLGMSAGRAAARAPAAAAKDPLARLDEPMAGKEEPAPELKAHEALTANKPIDKALPVQPVKATTTRDEAGATVVEVTAPPQIPADATAAPAPAAQPLVAPSPSPSSSTSSTTSSTANATRSSSSPRTSSASRVLARIATPTPKASSAHHGSYTIQVASSQRRPDAERVARKLSARGARVVAADVPGKGRWYRVQIGEYPSKDAAARQLASLSRAGVQGVVTTAAR